MEEKCTQWQNTFGFKIFNLSCWCFIQICRFNKSPHTHTWLTNNPFHLLTEPLVQNVQNAAGPSPRPTGWGVPKTRSFISRALAAINAADSYRRASSSRWLTNKFSAKVTISRASTAAQPRAMVRLPLTFLSSHFKQHFLSVSHRRLRLRGLQQE
jgi:hypothetical protein